MVLLNYNSNQFSQLSSEIFFSKSLFQAAYFWKNLSQNVQFQNLILLLSPFIFYPYGANLSEFSSAAWRAVQLFNEG